MAIVDFRGNLGSLSLYGLGLYGKGLYSAAPFAPTFAGDFVIVGRVDFSGDLAFQVAFGGALLVDFALQGDLPVRVDLACSDMISGPLWPDAVPCPPPAWGDAESCPPPLWTPVGPCESVDWEKADPYG